MRELRHRLATAPLAVHAVVLTVWFGVATWALGRFVEDEPPNRWVGHAIGAVLWGAFMTVYLARQRKRNGGAEDQWALTTAIRTGEPPDDVDVERWRPRLERLHRQNRLARWQAPLLFGALSVLSIGFAASGEPKMWLIAAALAAMAVAGGVLAPRRLRRIERLLRRLDERAPVDR